MANMHLYLHLRVRDVSISTVLTLCVLNVKWLVESPGTAEDVPLLLTWRAVFLGVIMALERAGRPKRLRPKDELEAVETRLRNILKLLQAFRPRCRGAKLSGKDWDVLKNVRAAIKVARYGQACSAEEAIAVAGQVQILCDLIDMQVDCLLARIRKARAQ